MAQLSTLSLLMQNTVIGVFIILSVLRMSAIIWNIAHVILFWRLNIDIVSDHGFTINSQGKEEDNQSFFIQQTHETIQERSQHIKSISKRFIYSIKTVRKYVDIWLQTNQHKTSWELHQRNIGRRRGYTTFHLFKLKEIIDEDGTLYLDELANGMQNQCGVMFTISTIVRMINRLQYTRKKVIALEFSVHASLSAK
eukprot:1086858_1